MAIIIVSDLMNEYKTLFLTEQNANTTIERLVDKGIVKCKIHFREFGADKLLKPNRLLSLSIDVEREAIVILQNQEFMIGNSSR